MKLMAAIFTLLIALLLLGVAYEGYAENARISSIQFGAYPDRFATRSTDGLTIQHAEEQGRLAAAGLEGLLGIILLFAAVVLCGPAERSPNSGDYDLTARKKRLAERAESRSTSTQDRTAPLPQSGRLRIEELRHQHPPTTRETHPPSRPTPPETYPDQDFPG